MDYFKNMNAKLSEGFKMTDYQCPKCSSNALVDDTLTNFYCCKCGKEIYMEDNEELEEV